MRERRLTLPTLPTGTTRPPKFAPDEATWRRIERAADFGTLSGADQNGIRRIADQYLHDASNAEKGVSFRRLSAHNAKLSKHLHALLEGLDHRGSTDIATREFLRLYSQELGQALKRGGPPEGSELVAITSTLSHLDQTLVRLGALFDNPSGWTQRRSASYFLIRLGDFYERKSGRRMSLRKDTQDLGVPSPFVAFVSAVWQALPAYNRKHRSLEAMSKRVEEAQVELAGEMSPSDVKIVSRA